MQVMPCFSALACADLDFSLCLSGSNESTLWQLRHSSELVVSMRVHTRLASSARWARNFSLVSITPVSLPQISKVALILRLISGQGACGTWQSAHTTCTPARFLSWIVSWNSAYTLSRISWQEMQNFCVPVHASPVAPPIATAMNATNATTPATNTRSATLPGEDESPRIASQSFLAVLAGTSFSP